MKERGNFIKTALVISLLTATLVTAMFVALATVWPEDRTEAITAEGVRSLVCLLELPAAGTKGGRTPADINKCLEDFNRLVREADK